MIREEKKEKRTKRIIEVATQLFLKQGYESTTVRQILKETGFSAGSCYNLFKNKEAILEKVMMEFCSEVIDLSKQITDKFDDSQIGQGVAVATEKYAIMSNSGFLNLYRSIWTVPIVQESILRFRTGNAQRISKHSKLKLEFDDVYIRVLASHAIERTLIEAKIAGTINLEPYELYALQTRMLYASFEVSRKRTEQTIQTVLEIMKKKGEQYKDNFIKHILHKL